MFYSNVVKRDNGAAVQVKTNLVCGCLNLSGGTNWEFVSIYSPNIIVHEYSHIGTR